MSGPESAARSAALAEAVAGLRTRPSVPAPAPDAAGVLARLANALHRHDTRFLDHFLRVLYTNSDDDVTAITDELLRKIESALAASEAGAGEVDSKGRWGSMAGVVEAAWLGAAAAWRAPRPPAAPRALLAMLTRLTHDQVIEVAAALHAALGARELVAASDALRTAAARGGGAGAAAWARAGGAGLPALLLRGAAATLLGAPHVRWAAGPLGVDELCAALAPRWNTLDTESQLTGAAVAARVVVAAAAEGRAGGAAAPLLGALAHPPPPALRHHPDFIQAIVALSRLQKLLDDV